MERAVNHIQFKVVVAGAFAVGKTTFINQISTIPVVGTEARTSGGEAAVKDSTTVGMEYGAYAIEDDDLRIELLLYGVPGQARFAFMWDIVAEGMDALLLLVDATKRETWAEARQLGHHILGQRDVPTLVGVRQLDDDVDSVEEVLRGLDIRGASAVRCEASDPSSARSTLLTLLDTLLQHLESADQTGTHL